MYSEVNLGDEISRYLIEVEGILGVPIRVLDAGFSRNFNPPNWNTTHIRNSGYTTRDGIAKGITVCYWGQISNGRAISQNNLPGGFYKDGEARTNGLSDFLQMGDTGIVEPVSIDGLVYGEVDERTVWIYLHPYYITDPHMLDLPKVFGEPIILSASPDLKEKMEETREARNREWFLGLVNQTRGEQELERLRGEISDYERQLRSYEERKQQSIVNLKQRQNDIDIVFSRLHRPEEEWLKEWEALTNHPRILKINFTSNDEIEFWTDRIVMSNEGEHYHLSDSIRVTMNISTCTILIFNEDGRRRNRDHPHVENNQPCWGALDATIHDLLADGKLGPVVEFIFQYLEGFNPRDDWGRYIAWWDDARIDSPDAELVNA